LSFSRLTRYFRWDGDKFARAGVHAQIFDSIYKLNVSTDSYKEQ